jgi:hypothetical protein
LKAAFSSGVITFQSCGVTPGGNFILEVFALGFVGVGE